MRSLIAFFFLVNLPLGCGGFDADIGVGLACSNEGLCPSGQSCFDGVCLFEAPAPGPGAIAPDAGVDTTAPTVLELTPANGTSGVSEDDSIVIRFSESMDPVSTQVAITIEPNTLLVSQEWNADNSEVTLHYDLEATEAVYPEEPGEAIGYTVSVSGIAEDAAGNPIDSEAAVTFTTLRRTLYLFPLDSALSGNTRPPTGTYYTFVGAGNNGYHGFMSFDFSGFPVERTPLVESATIESAIRGISNAPFEQLADMSIEHSTFATREEAVEPPTLRDLGVFIAAESNPQVDDEVRKDVTAVFLDDVAERIARGNRSQYVLRFPAFLTSGFAHIYNNRDVVRTQLVIRTVTP